MPQTQGGTALKLRVIAQSGEYDEVFEVEKWYAGDLMLKKKGRRRLEIDSLGMFRSRRPGEWFNGYLKGQKGYDYVSFQVVD